MSTRFIDGPAKGRTLSLKRTPIFLPVVYDAPSKRFPVDAASADRARKRCFDQRSRGATIERMHGGIRIMDLHAGGAEHGGGGRFAHADRAGEAKHEHQAPPSMSATTRARSSGVTCGFAPNQHSNPGTAW